MTERAPMVHHYSYDPRSGTYSYRNSETGATASGIKLAPGRPDRTNPTRSTAAAGAEQRSMRPERRSVRTIDAGALIPAGDQVTAAEQRAARLLGGTL